MSSSPGDVTLLLHRARDTADVEAREELFHLVRRMLFQIARRHMAGQKPGHTLQATILVDEAFCHLVNNERVQWEDRRHFFCYAAEEMGRILAKHAERKRPQQLPSGEEALDQASEIGTDLMQQETIVKIFDALQQIEGEDAQACEVLRLYWFFNWQFRFGDLDGENVMYQAEPGRAHTFKEIGDLLGISRAKAHRVYKRAVEKLQEMLPSCAS